MSIVSLFYCSNIKLQRKRKLPGDPKKFMFGQEVVTHRENMALDVDTVLQHIGQFGPYQIRILVLFLFMIFPITYQTLIMVFIAFEPPWMCTEGSASCLGANFTNGSSAEVYSTATKPKSLYERRCSLNRTDWKFADYELYDGPHLTIVNQVTEKVDFYIFTDSAVSSETRFRTLCRIFCEFHTFTILHRLL